MVTEEKDREEEVVYITSALKTCGYPRWSIEKWKYLVVNKEREKKKKKKKKNWKGEEKH